MFLHSYIAPPYRLWSLITITIHLSVHHLFKTLGNESKIREFEKSGLKISRLLIQNKAIVNTCRDPSLKHHCCISRYLMKVKSLMRLVLIRNVRIVKLVESRNINTHLSRSKVSILAIY